MATSLSVLILEDRPADAELMLHALRRAGYEPDWRRVETEPDYVAHLEPTLDVILADYNLPQSDALRALQLLQERNLDIPFIVVTGTIGEEAAVECMKQGAADYLLKDRLARLGPAVAHVLDQKRLRDAKRQTEEALSESEARYRRITQAVTDYIYTVHVENGRAIETWHSAGCIAVTGYTSEDFAADPYLWHRMVVDEDRPAVENQARRVLAGEDMSPLEHRIVRKDGAERWVRNTPVPHRDGEGKLLSYDGLVQDITERKRAEDALRRRAEELAALQATVLEITAPHDLPTLLRTIVERAALLLNASGGGLYLCDPSHREVRCVVSHNTLSDYTGIVLKYGEGAAGIVAQTGQPLIVDDYRIWSGRASVYEEGQPFTAVLSVPMIWQGQVTGVIHVLHTVESQRFSKADLELLTLFANHAAIAVENTRLYEAVQQELAERKQAEQVQAAIYRILEATQSAQNLDELYSSIHAIIGELMPARNFYIALYDASADLLSFPYQVDEFDLPWPPIKLGKGLTAFVLRTGKPLLATPEVFQQLVQSGQVQVLGKPAVTWLGVPLKTTQGILGIMAVQTYSESDRLTEADMYMLVFVSSQVAMAIERKQAEESLRESEERYRLLFESNPFPMWVYDLESLAFLAVNDAAIQHYGYSRHEFLSMTLQDIRPAEEVPALLDNVAHVTAGLDKAGDWRHRKKDGTLIDVEITSHTLMFAGRRAEVVLAHDVTERKRAEAALRQSEDKFSKAFHTSPDSININRLKDGLYLEINPGFTALTGYTAEDVRGKTSLELALWANPEDRARLIQGLRERGEASNLEASFRLKDGQVRTGLMSARLIEINGEMCIISITRDITERKRAERVQVATYRISEATQSAQNLDELYRSIHAIIGELMPARNFYIALYDASADLFYFPYHADELDDVWPPVRSGKSLTGYVLRTGKPLLATPQVFDQLVESDQIELIGTPSVDWLGVPLKTVDGMIGVMAVQAYTEAARLSEDDKDVLVFVSTQVAMAIERKQAEEALRKSQALLRAIIENLPFEFWACGSDGRYLMQNAFDIKLWGNLVGKTLEEMGLPEDESALWRANHRRAFAGEFVRGEHARTIEGDKKNYDSIIGPIRDGEMISGILGIRIDITERKQAEEQIKKLNRMLRVMNEANQALVRAADETELLQHVCQIIAEVGGYRLAWVGLAEQDEARTVRPVAAAGHDEGYVSTVNITWADDERGCGPTGTAIRTVQPAIARNILTDPFYTPWREQAVQRGYASSIALPLSASGRVLGALNIYAAEPDAFDQAEIKLLIEMADDLAYGLVALRTRAGARRAEERIQRLNLDLERRARELAALNQAGQIMASTLDLDTLLGRIMEQVQSLLEAQAVSVMLVTLTPDKTEEELVFVAATSPGSKNLIGARLPITAGIAGWVMRQRQSALVVDAQTDLRFFGDIDRVTGMTTRSVLAVPLIVKGSALGVIEAINKATVAFDQHDLEVLEALSNSAAIAIENARLYATEQERVTALARALEQQRELDRLQREFIQNVSHELRTPLAIVRGHAELLGTGWFGELLPDQRESIAIILRRTQMLTRLVDDIVSVLEHEGRELKREPVDLTQLVSTSLTDFQATAQKGGPALSAETAPNLLPVSGDSMALRRALDNLIGNACKFTPAGGRVTVRLWQSQAGTLLQVADTGIGIAPEHLGRIFERFYQVDGSSTRRYGGIGLGLALVKEIVEAHGGQITVTSELGKGTTFTIVLPTA